MPPLRTRWTHLFLQPIEPGDAVGLRRRRLRLDAPAGSIVATDFEPRSNIRKARRRSLPFPTGKAQRGDAAGRRTSLRLPVCQDMAWAPAVVHEHPNLRGSTANDLTVMGSRVAADRDADCSRGEHPGGRPVARTRSRASSQALRQGAYCLQVGSSVTSSLFRDRGLRALNVKLARSEVTARRVCPRATWRRPWRQAVPDGGTHGAPHAKNVPLGLQARLHGSLDRLLVIQIDGPLLGEACPCMAPSHAIGSSRKSRRPTVRAVAPGRHAKAALANLTLARHRPGWPSSGPIEPGLGLDRECLPQLLIVGCSGSLDFEAFSGKPGSLRRAAAESARASVHTSRAERFGRRRPFLDPR